MNKAPFSKELVDSLNERQKNNQMHPYICGGTHSDCKRTKSYAKRREGEEVPYTDENEGVLTATTEGWVCPCGKYKQDWCH